MSMTKIGISNILHLKAVFSNFRRFQYTTDLSYDGSFQLVRRQRAHDAFDICLTDGLMYFVHQASYEQYLDRVKDEAFQNSRVSEHQTISRNT